MILQKEMKDYLYYCQFQKKLDYKTVNDLVLRDIAVVELLFATGLRISELCNLKNELFDLHEGVLCTHMLRLKNSRKF